VDLLKKKKTSFILLVASYRGHDLVSSKLEASDILNGKPAKA